MQTQFGLTVSQRLQAAVIAAVASPAIAAICSTLRWTVEGAEHLEHVMRSERQPIIAFWHGRVLAGLHYFRGRGIVVMTSRNFDGEWISRTIHRFGYRTARGSTSRGAARALVQMRQDLRGGRPVAFAIDGPRGPARVAQPGAVWLAGATGHPILPFHIEASDFWTLRSWDRTQIPRPFSRLAMAIGDPMTVPDTADDVVEAARVALEESLRRLEKQTTLMLSAPQSR